MRAGWWSCPHPNMSKSSWIHLHLRVKKSTLLLMATRDPANWTSWYGKNIPLSTGSYVTSQEVGRISEPSTVVNHHEAWQTDHPSNLIFWKHHGFWHHAFGTLRTSKQQYPRRFLTYPLKKGPFIKGVSFQPSNFINLQEILLKESCTTWDLQKNL